MTAFGDALRAVRLWALAVPGLCGTPGAPLANGLHLSHRDGGAGAGPYGIIYPTDGAVHDAGVHGVARISGEFYGPNLEAAYRAACGYAAAVVGIGAHPLPDPAVTAAGTITTAGNITGPVFLPDAQRPRYIVDADFVIAYA